MAASRTAYSFLGSSRVVCILGLAFGLGWGPGLGREREREKEKLGLGGFILGRLDACQGRSNKVVHGSGGGGGRLGLLLIPPFCLSGSYVVGNGRDG